ncbi:uncharacterized protein N7503_005621 [Penicillium pulvis]|uniref:uncharacterized protein n=1 Tax=Penicillium pulvis TaxID=1562058 RepID=UPI0025482A24|nr:uncharacterized protein N7503_005621 [Penicillium pulvis]KAJ5803171.1 hypothetical protein N7503_005621 [Penicillium pulvis]
MPRTLPWLLEKKDEGRVKQESTPRKRVKREADADPDLTPKPPASPGRRDFMRSSQTPPTSPARPCPTEEFLVEGLDKDDAWVMVEDEFYAIAQTFTQHLHYAEYVRRKKEAKARSAAAIKELERPTDGQTAMPKALQMRKNAEALDARQKDGLAQLEAPVDDNPEEHTDEEDGAWAGTHLHGLMTSPRKSRSLVGAHAVKSSTRAAAGFGQASRPDRKVRRSEHAITAPAVQSIDVIDLETASEEDSDIDGGIYPVVMPSFPTRQESTPSRTAERSTPPAKRQISGTPMKSTLKTPTLHKERSTPTQRSNKPGTGFKSRVQMLFDDFDELPESSQPISYISDQKEESTPGNSAAKEASGTNNLVSESRYNDVPTFLM